jgi:uncharacterized protein
MHLGFPYRIDGRGRSERATANERIRDLIELVLFTAPGERINRPDFGSGLLQLVFGPNSPEVASATEYVVQGALQKWLGDLIRVERVEVAANEGKLRVEVGYLVLRDQERQVATFTREVVG